ncbi:hypothetical protein RUM43_003045 [Polyplax serrata]|uniref:Uncharacterized protein n=1 Tax=Polyplax serrata TaxID=468196 RepID=A0AAN8RWJ9_POLSC
MKKQYYKTHFKTRHVYDDDNGSSEEENTDEFGYNEGDEDIDTLKKEILYYAIPRGELSKGGTNILLKPVVLYKDNSSHKHKRLSSASSTLRHEEIISPGPYIESRRGILNYRVNF